MDNIVKLNSDFYALASAESCEQYEKTGKLIDWKNAALIKWDGKKGTTYPYNVDGSSFEYYIAADNTVYYTDKGGKNARVWCAGNKLAQHCHHLQQIEWRRTA